MVNLHRLTINYMCEEAGNTYARMYGDLEPQYANIIVWTTRLALENIANSDALYHNLEHTVMVTLAGQAILEGKHLSEGGVTPVDWLHFMIALLCHDIGYVRGVCRQDNKETCAIGVGDRVVILPRGGTDVALTPYHVDRSKLFVRERFGENVLIGKGQEIDVQRIIDLIEMTRFPVAEEKFYGDSDGYKALLRAADFIGQLGDPNYFKKAPALFYEFEEIGGNEKYGYKMPGDLRKNFASFYWNVVNPYIKGAIKYLKVTDEGRQWIANMHSHVFAAENSS